MTQPKTPKSNGSKQGRSSVFIGAAIAVIILLTAVLVLSIIFSKQGTNPDTPAVILPSPIASGDPAQDSSGDNSAIHRAEVNVDTVQAVVSTLTRADSYVRTVTVERFSAAGNSSSTLNVWVRGPSTRIEVSDRDVSKSILITGEELYIWYSDSSEYYQGSADGGHAEADAYQRLLSYEELLSLPGDAILDAGYQEFSGESCIFADYTAGELGYRNIVYISVSSGLLMGCETYDGNTLIYRMVSDPPNITTPSDEVFAPPA
jgi:hypothetical protein